MTLDAKKVAAAVAAVNQYLSDEAHDASARGPAPSAAPSVWALSGRQRLMQNRELLAARLWK